ncbi:MAG TPA: hypothetical protein VFE58_17920 [Tepidisphaeraceae bacterium]|jgi:hypothetical protein|nr:hypothetical protein [Tepidisphaeraceae bacterium]
MTDPNHTGNLSEISHLFLSGVRDMHQTGSPRPTRIPPKQNVSIDMTPEEFAAAQRGQSIDKTPSSIGPISALLASHFDTNLLTRVTAYARHLAATTNQRVGIIEIDSSLFRLHTVEKTLGSSNDSSEPASFESHQLAEALDEMNWDIDRWLLLLPSPRTPEARALLRACTDWTLLTTSDHDGMVAAYRTLKSLHDAARPHLSLAVLDATPPEAERLHHKLTSVCSQFLNRPLSPDYTCVTPAPANIQSHPVLIWQPTHDKTQLATSPHWKITTDFLHRAAKPAAPVDDAPELSQAESDFVTESPAPSSILYPLSSPTPSPAPDASIPEILDLPNHDPAQILPALLQQSAGQLIECPIRPPMCPESRLAITRDRRILLLAVARQGLSDLRTIGQAYRWLTENRPLISMALPQFSLDPHQLPTLRLLINHTDLSADLLQPLLQSSTVTVQSYRTLKWGAKTGLLLEAA